MEHSQITNPGDECTALRGRAEQGDIQAQIELGKLNAARVHPGSQSVQQHAFRGEALKWYRRAAEQGNVQAQCALAKLCADLANRLHPDSYGAEALKWYLSAAEHGDISAIKALGDLYRHGSGFVKFDSSESMKWIRKAAELGDEGAQVSLGDLLRRTTSVSEAERWYLTAANSGNSAAMTRLADLYRAGGFQFPANKTEARKWYRKSLETPRGEDNSSVYFSLGNMDYQDENYIEAMNWYRRAAESGHAEAQYRVGQLHHDGKGVPQSSTQAFRWYEIALAVSGIEIGKIDFIARQFGQHKNFDWRRDAISRLDSITAEMSGAEISKARQLAWESHEWPKELKPTLTQRLANSLVGKL